MRRRKRGLESYQDHSNSNLTFALKCWELINVNPLHICRPGTGRQEPMAGTRADVVLELSRLAVSNPALADKLIFPQIPAASLRASYAQR